MIERERQILRHFIFSPTWKVIEGLAETMIQSIEKRSRSFDSEWETIRHTLLDEGQVTGVRNLMQNIITLAGQDDKT